MFKKELDQNIVYEFFQKVFETKKLVRSYLFLGDNKADKAEFAYELAKLLNCDRNKRVWLDKIGNNINQNALFAVEEALYQKACETCQSCLWLNERAHPKTPVFIESTGAKNTIQVETVRKLQEDLSQSSEHFRIIVFDDASHQSLTKGSSAALLKTIEEAKPNTMFLFFANSKENVLSTIVSRCQYVLFNSSKEQISSDEIKDLKDKIKSFINSSNLNDELLRMSNSEELAQEERGDLIEAFSLVQKELSESQLNLDNSRSIMICEELIYDIKSFIKVKAALKSCFDKLSKLEFNFEPA